jgi:hypothetical protein
MFNKLFLKILSFEMNKKYGTATHSGTVLLTAFPLETMVTRTCLNTLYVNCPSFGIICQATYWKSNCHYSSRNNFMTFVIKGSRNPLIFVFMPVILGDCSVQFVQLLYGINMIRGV